MNTASWRDVEARVSGVAWVLAGQMLQSLASFLTVAAVGRWAGANELGVFALSMSCYFLVISVADTLIATPYTYLHAHTPIEGRDRLAFAGAAGAALVGGAAALALTLLWWRDWSALAHLWPVLPGVVLLTVLREFLRRHLLVSRRYGALFVCDASLALLQVSAVLGLAFWGRITAFNAVAAVGSASAVSIVTTTGLRWLPPIAVGRQALRYLPQFLRESWRFGRWLFMGGLCHVGSVQLYPWLAMASGGVRQAGLYAACLSVVGLINPLLLGLSNYFRPRFMQELGSPPRSAVFAAYVAKRAAVFVLPALVWAVALVVFGSSALELLYGAEFRGGGTALSWMGWGTLAVAVAAPVQLALLALYAPATNLAYHGFNLTLLVAASWLGWGGLTVTRLGQFFGAINVLATLLLIMLLRARLKVLKP